MSFASKKEADAYDKMLDLAEVLGTWLGQSPVALDDEQREAMAMWIAEQKDVLGNVLKAGKMPSPKAVADDAPAKRTKAA